MGGAQLWPLQRVRLTYALLQVKVHLDKSACRVTEAKEQSFDSATTSGCLEPEAAAMTALAAGRFCFDWLCFGDGLIDLLSKAFLDFRQFLDRSPDIGAVEHIYLDMLPNMRQFPPLSLESGFCKSIDLEISDVSRKALWREFALRFTDHVPTNQGKRVLICQN